MKKVYLLAIIILTFLSCKERIKMEKISKFIIKKLNIVSKLLVIKSEYFIRGCNFEILINGFPIERYYGLGMVP